MICLLVNWFSSEGLERGVPNPALWEPTTNTHGDWANQGEPLIVLVMLS